MRDKLIDLIQNAVGGCARHWAELIADALIANGVTIADVPDTNVGKWIPVSERLPITEWNIFMADMDWEVYPCLCTVKRTDGIRYVTKLFFTGENFVDAEYVRYTEQVTHWMPMPSAEGLNDT